MGYGVCAVEENAGEEKEVIGERLELQGEDYYNGDWFGITGFGAEKILNLNAMLNGQIPFVIIPIPQTFREQLKEEFKRQGLSW